MGLSSNSSPTSNPPPGATPLRAAVLSALLPGLGHLRTRPLLARNLIALTVAVLMATALWLATHDRQDLVALTLRPSWLVGVVALSLMTLLVRAVVTIDAARSAGLAQSRHRLVSRLSLIIVLAGVAAPHLVAATLAWQQRSLLERVFTAQDTVAARPNLVAGPQLPGPTGSVPAIPVDEQGRPMITSEAIPVISSEQVENFDRAPPIAAETPTPTTEPPPEPAPETWDGEDRLSIVMLGSDGGYDRKGIRTDTIIVLSIDVASGDAVTFSVPRNWQNVPFPTGSPAAERYPGGNPDLANTVYSLGTRRPELFPGAHPGGTAIKQAMAQTLGVPIHYFVMVDMTAVVDTIDLFGGIELTVSEHINDRIRPIEPGGPYLDINVGPGTHHFDGLTTLAYIRSRVQSWDYSRMARQRCVVGALIDQAGPVAVATNYGPFTDIVADHVVTDIPLDRADELLAIAARIDIERMQSVNFVPPEFPSGQVPLDKVRAAVANALTADPIDNPTRSLTNACGATQ